MTEWGAFAATDIGDVPSGTSAPEFGDVVRGRYYMPDPATRKPGYRTRVTTFAERLEDMWGLNAWEKRTILYGLTLREDLYVKACGTPADDTKGLDEIVRDAKEAGGGSVGANFGTGLHGLFNAHDASEPDRAPVKYRRKVDLYAEAVRANHLTVHPDLAERLVLNTRYGLCGRMDGAVDESGRSDLTVIDYKSQAAWHSWGKVAIQLACYAQADMMWLPTQATYADMPPMRLDRALVFWVPVRSKDPEAPEPDFVEVIEVDIDRAWEYACPLAEQVRQWQSEGKRKGALSRPYVPVARDLSAVERFGARLQDAATVVELKAIHAAGIKSGVWCEELRQVAELSYGRLIPWNFGSEEEVHEAAGFIRGKGYV